MINPLPTAMIAMSGGVDSAVAALLMKEQGFAVTGVTMRLFCDGENIPLADNTTADITPDIRDARAVADRLGIPHLVCRLEKTFFDCVVNNFIHTYLAGGTPNPCVTCNKTIKFGALLDFAKANGLDYAATGHYARIAEEDGRYLVRRAKDEKKDQTYMLWRLPQRVLSKLILPLSDMLKSEIREQSRTAGLSAADRTDSQEICFLPDGNYAEFIESRAGASIKGSFIDEAGNVLGEHKGIIHYTVGQRRGLGISAASRIFVTKIDPVSNTVTLSPNDSFATCVSVSGIVYSGMKPLYDGEELNLSVKLRYAARPTAATVKFFGDRAEVLLAEPVRAVTPGQSAVFYDGDLLLAGGFIDTAKS
jgi:tRNA-specific 2-thiouridylase